MSAARLSTFSASDIEGLRPAMKIGMLATVNAEGLPHLTLLSSLKASSPTTLTFGQFTEGQSKVNVRANPRAGFLAMTLQKELWRGTATFSRTEKSGPDYEAYNNEPMFRYNAYFGIHTVFSLELVEHSGKENLPMGQIVTAALATAAASAAARRGAGYRALNPWTRTLMSGLGNLKFAAYVASDGYPRIIPVLQARAVAGDRILFSLAAYGAELAGIPAGASVAVFGMTLDMEDVLLRGKLAGTRRVCGIRCGVVEVDWVYNPMPPIPGQIYPIVELSPVATFNVPGRI